MIQSIKRLFSYASGHKRNMVLSVTLAIGSVAAGIFPYFLIQRLVIELLSPAPREPHAILLSASIGGLLLLKSVLFACSTAQSHKTAYRILYNIRMRLAEKLTRLPLGYVLDRDSGALKKVMENDVEELERFLAHNIPETISSAVVPLGVMVYLFFLDWRMALSFLVFVPFAAFFYRLMMKGSKKKMEKYYTSVDTMNAVVVEYVDGMKEIKAFNQSQGSFSRFKNAVEHYRRYVLDWFKSSWPMMSAYSVLLQAATVSVLPAGLWLTLSGSLDTPTLVLFLLISMGFAAPLVKLAEFADGIILVVNAEQNVHAILSERDMQGPVQPEKPCGNDIAFENVDFAYGTEQVLHQISFTATEGKTLAVIGPSGSGKSTVAKLICRFWDVNGGSVKLGGADIRSLSPGTLMAHISFVFQDTFLFNISLGDNIRVGKPGATGEEVTEAAKKARCHDFILKTEHGYDTLAGEGGSHLSGGERQRICIARAILKNAPVLILDEATASIDPDSEEQIQEALGALAKGKTLIVIAHRIRTIMGFDQIVVLDKGRVEASGSHEALLEKSRMYQKIFAAYAKTEAWQIGSKEGEALC